MKMQVMVWKTNFDRVLDDRILIPVATNHKRHDPPLPPGIVKAPPTESAEDAAAPEEDRPSLDEILQEKMHGACEGGDAPGMVANTLQHIVGELNVMSQTLGLLVQRITLNEDRVTKLESLMQSSSEN